MPRTPAPPPPTGAAPQPSAAKSPGRKPPVIELREPERPKLSPLPFVGALVLVVAGSAFALFSPRNDQDPHLVRAKELVARHEHVLPPEAIDYDHAVYAEALAELGLVDRGSRWAADADDMVADLRGKIAAQQARVRARNAEMQARQEKQQQRDEEFFRVVRMDPHDPNEPTPECDEEGKGAGHGEGGAHRH